MIEAFTLLLLLHIAGVIVAAGGATMSDALFFRTIRNMHFSRDEHKLLKETGKVIWAGYGLTVLTGIGLVLNQLRTTGEITYLENSYFTGKLILAGVIAGNGVVFHGKVLPFLSSHLEENMKEEEFCKRFWLFSLTGAISIVFRWFTVMLRSSALNSVWRP